MSFRRKINRHDWWLKIIRENATLLDELPKVAILDEAVFRDYLTHSQKKSMGLTPSVFELSQKALVDLDTFITHKAQFDMDVLLFDDFNAAIRAHRQTNSL